MSDFSGYLEYQREIRGIPPSRCFGFSVTQEGGKTTWFCLCDLESIWDLCDMHFVVLDRCEG